MSLALVERRKWVPVDYELSRRPGGVARVPDDGRRKRRPSTSSTTGLGSRFTAIAGAALRRPPSGRSSAATPARATASASSSTRRRASGRRKIALGHHMDDIARTTMMNLLFHGEVATMMPVQQFFGGTGVDHPAAVRGARDRRWRAWPRGSACPLPRTGARTRTRNQRGLMKEILRHGRLT